ncbi:50S ribosomal protein L15 [bacterium]|nr:50S ribosomal protein L15 [bacterium]
MKLHELPGDPGMKQKKKRLGRGEGSGRGKTAGKGHKGKQARSGSGKGPYFEGGQMPLIRRIPKFGFSNPFRVEYEAVNVAALEKKFEAGATVDRAALEAAKLVRTSKPVKVLGNGEISKALTIKANAFSKSAAEKIAAAGGTAEVV